MSFQFNGIPSAEVSINGAVTTTFANPTAAQVKRVTGTLNVAMSTIYTVPEGYTYFLYGILIPWTPADTFNIYHDDGTTKIAQLKAYATAPYTQPMLMPSCPIDVFTEGQSVKGTAGGNNGCQCYLYGVLVAN